MRGGREFVSDSVKTAILVLITCLITLGVSEMAYRSYLERNSPAYPLVGVEHPLYHHDLRPNFSGLQRYGTETAPYYTNNLGFRDAAVRNIPAVANRYRLVFLGDSFTEG